jgi:branched-chain amino acid transport system ATP-binding protein
MRLELRDVIAGYGESAVLRQVTLTVPSSSVVALLGPNGAGKTTLLRVAAGLLRANSGSVWLGDQKVDGWSAHRRVAAGICLIPEGRGIFPGLTVAENLRLHQVGSRSAARVREAEGLEAVYTAFPRLAERRTQLAGTLSGGEQQMVALARAHVQQARVVLLDEVSMGLAPKRVDEIFTFIRQLARGGTSLLLVEQYVRRALEISDVVYLLGGGRVTFAGEAAELEQSRIFAEYIGSGSR